MRKNATLLLLAVALSSGALAEPPERPETPMLARMTVTPKGALPGIPRRVEFTLRNLSNQPAAFPEEVVLLTRTRSGDLAVLVPPQTIIYAFDTGNFAQALRQHGSVIPPRGSAKATVDMTGALGSPPWFADEWFGLPGEMVLIAALGSYLNDASAEELFRCALVSNEVRVTIQEPKGDDLLVWSTLQQHARGRWDAEALQLDLDNPFFGMRTRHMLFDLVRDYPDSAYTGWLVATGVGTPGESIRALRQWLSTHPEAECRDERRLILADRAYNASTPVGDESDRLYAEALAIYRDLAKNGSSAAIREEARRNLRGSEEEE